MGVGVVVGGVGVWREKGVMMGRVGGGVDEVGGEWGEGGCRGSGRSWGMSGWGWWGGKGVGRVRRRKWRR